MEVTTDTLAELLKAQRRTNKLLARLVEMEEERRRDELDMLALNDALNAMTTAPGFDPATDRWMRESPGKYLVWEVSDTESGAHGTWRPATAAETDAINAGVKQQVRR